MRTCLQVDAHSCGNIINQKCLQLDIKVSRFTAKGKKRKFCGNFLKLLNYRNMVHTWFNMPCLHPKQEKQDNT